MSSETKDRMVEFYTHKAYQHWQNASMALMLLSCGSGVLLFFGSKLATIFTVFVFSFIMSLTIFFIAISTSRRVERIIFSESVPEDVQVNQMKKVLDGELEDRINGISAQRWAEVRLLCVIWFSITLPFLFFGQQDGYETLFLQHDKTHPSILVAMILNAAVGLGYVAHKKLDLKEYKKNVADV